VTPEPAAHGQARPGPLRRLLARGLVRAGVVTYVFSGVTMVTYLVSGVILARALGPDGRGITAALTQVIQLAAFVFAMGASRSLSYFIARRPEDGPSLFTTWTLMLIPLTLVAIGLTQLLLPTIFATDGEHAIEIGRWFTFTIVLAVGLELIYGLLLGVQDFVFFNAVRLGQPALISAAFAVLWLQDELTVESALISSTAATALTLVVGIARALKRIGIGPFAPRMGLTTLWYGIRGQGQAVASTLTARLDVAILPAFVVSASVGLYSVATNVSLIVYHLSNIFAGVVVAAVSAHPDRAQVKVIGSLWASLALAGLLALCLGLVARPILGLVYGDPFRSAAEPLVLLLPGAVLFAGSSILAAGIYAAGRPFTATLAQVAGTVVTVVGLLVFVPSGGITAAALVSTASYATVFVATLVMYKRVSETPWRWFVPTPARLRELDR
jgi:O-antigen/teichoic acid export membrane protein